MKVKLTYWMIPNQFSNPNKATRISFEVETNVKSENNLDDVALYMAPSNGHIHNYEWEIIK